MVNPYILASALLQAFDDGLARKLDPGEPESRNIYQAMKEGKSVKKLPLTLGEALERLDDDAIIKKAMPDEMYRVFTHYKGDEWARFNAQVTEWDVARYLDCLP
jgi:glutamine synthetase